MPDLRDLDFLKQIRTESARPHLEHGIIAATPSDITELVPVVLPEFDNALTWGPCRWSSRTGQDFPSEGDDCLVAFSNRREPWILAWFPGSTYTPPADSVSSVFGRTGDVVAQSGDYSAFIASQIAANGPHISSGALSAGPPGSPLNGDIWIATGVDSNGTVWQFRYNAGSSSAYKWEFIGGPPVYIAVETSETTTSTTYVDLATAGPSFTCVRGGDYMTLHSADMYNSGGTAGWGAIMSISVGGSTASDTDALYQVVPGSIQANFNFGGKINKYTGVAAGATIKNQYRVATAGTANFAYRRLQITPVRIS